MYEEWLIGFDAREMWLSPDDLWTPQRRDLFLLDWSVVKPLSIDPGVWWPIHKADEQLVPLLPDWVGPRGGWDKLNRLTDYLKRIAISQSYWIVALTEIVDTGDREKLEEFARYGIEPSALKGDWKLLGYDVADYACTSFLTNAGYEEFEAARLRNEWIESLNEHHLFTERDQALRYVEVAYQRDAQHGPFSAYGLYLIQKVA